MAAKRRPRLIRPAEAVPRTVQPFLQYARSCRKTPETKEKPTTNTTSLRTFCAISANVRVAIGRFQISGTLQEHHDDFEGGVVPLTKEETFHIDEYKSLRDELTTKLKDRLEFNRWGLIGVAALYSYILNNPKPTLFVVPVILSIILIWHLSNEHKGVKRIADYIRDDLERWLAATRTAGPPVTGGPGGWETHLGTAGGGSLWWWSPLPLWYAMLVLTVVVAIVAWTCPSLFAAPPPTTS